MRSQTKRKLTNLRQRVADAMGYPHGRLKPVVEYLYAVREALLELDERVKALETQEDSDDV